MPDRTLSIEGVRVPRFLYGTAWKEDETQRLTELALRQGFRAIDTANQRRHYHEAAVGQAIAASVGAAWSRRDDLFLQTKFTFRRRAGPPAALRPRRPDRDPGRTVVRQLARASGRRRQSIPTCCTVPPSGSAWPRPIGRPGGRWKPSTTAAGFVCSVSATSPSNSSSASARQARVRPRFVQNRCYAVQGWDRRVREFCSRQRNGLPGLLSADRQPRGDGPS